MAVHLVGAQVFQTQKCVQWAKHKFWKRRLSATRGQVPKSLAWQVEVVNSDCLRRSDELQSLKIKDPQIGHDDLELVNKVTSGGVLRQQSNCNPEHHPSGNKKSTASEFWYIEVIVQDALCLSSNRWLAIGKKTAPFRSLAKHQLQGWRLLTMIAGERSVIWVA